MSQTKIRAHLSGVDIDWDGDALIDSGSPENTVSHDILGALGVKDGPPDLGAPYQIELSTDISTLREFKFIESPGVNDSKVVLGMNV